MLKKNQLRDAYLRVLEPLLENTQLRLEPYKERDTYKVLISLLNPGMQRKVNSTTKRLVKRILEDWYEKICGHSSFYQQSDNLSSPHLTHVHSTGSSASSGPTTPADDIAIDDISTVVTRKEVKKQLHNNNNHPLHSKQQDIVV